MAAKHPSKQDIKLAVDTVIFTVRDGQLQVLLIEMKKKPYVGMWALPGGLLGDDETAENAGRRLLAESTGVKGAYLEQLATFDAPDRDALGRVVSVAMLAFIPPEGVTLRVGEKYADARWFPAERPPKLAYDHVTVLAHAAARLRSKITYSNIAWSLLPPSFPLTRLREAYEVILKRRIDKRNFRKRMLELGFIEPTGKREQDVAHRPAELYRFVERRLVIKEVF